MQIVALTKYIIQGRQSVAGGRVRKKKEGSFHICHSRKSLDITQFLCKSEPMANLTSLKAPYNHLV